MIARIALLSTLVALTGNAQTVPQSNPVVVELFTSEGCSSCPPADKLLQRLNHTRTSSGQLVIAISEHVTYWNQLGWKDPFSAETYTARQQGYGTQFQLPDVYTPQMVINGQQQIVGNDEAGLTKAFQNAARQPQMALNILSADAVGKDLAVRFSAKGLSLRDPLKIIAVLTQDEATSSVKRGENSGRTLAHVAVARSLTTVATVKQDGEQTVRVPIDASLAAAGTKRHLVLLAQESSGAVAGSDTRSF
ncbi:DUF1223 domain-containing protein [Terriglobus tenax]|uniref:DUF1223 domain-containing protein n=1 Tax=Terriglobus tenax TaxID=1111115 RepID=UPI0021DFBC8C|nr:DUF1223 domain-containing protein [Terriglobus tenax]